MIQTKRKIFFSPALGAPYKFVESDFANGEFRTFDYSELELKVLASLNETHPCVFKDENGNEYISSPEADFEIEYTILILTGVLMPYLTALSLWIGGVL